MYLDVVQGENEHWSESYISYGEVKSAVFDEVIHQKYKQCS